MLHFPPPVFYNRERHRSGAPGAYPIQRSLTYDVFAVYNVWNEEVAETLQALMIKVE